MSNNLNVCVLTQEDYLSIIPNPFMMYKITNPSKHNPISTYIGQIPFEKADSSE